MRMTAEPTADPSSAASPSPSASAEPDATTAGAFFIADGDSVVPTQLAASPWGPVLHGRMSGGLAARAVQQVLTEDPDLVCTRLTIDMFKSAPLAPMQVSAKTVRSGRRIKVLEVTVEQDGVAIGQGKFVLLRRSEQPAGTFRVTPGWAAMAPERLGPPDQSKFSGLDGAAEGHSWTAPHQSWRVNGASGPQSAGTWVRDVVPLVAGEPLTPIIRLGLAGDLASGEANTSDRGLHFINADYTVYLGRELQGEFIGLQPYGHVSDRGVAVGQCIVHDQLGPVGFIATTALAN
jgi:Thioesterase-like superfamily